LTSELILVRQSHWLIKQAEFCTKTRNLFINGKPHQAMAFAGLLQPFQ
jgi:hypothetical protein